jgi:hypothetical protein
MTALGRRKYDVTDIGREWQIRGTLKRKNI